MLHLVNNMNLYSISNELIFHGQCLNQFYKSLTVRHDLKSLIIFFSSSLSVDWLIRPIQRIELESHENLIKIYIYLYFHSTLRIRDVQLSDAGIKKKQEKEN